MLCVSWSSEAKGVPPVLMIWPACRYVLTRIWKQRGCILVFVVCNCRSILLFITVRVHAKTIVFHYSIAISLHQSKFGEIFLAFMSILIHANRRELVSQRRMKRSEPSQPHSNTIKHPLLNTSCS